jgi:cytochrome c peroxidase
MLVEKLAATDFYSPLFAAAFSTPEVTSERIRDALAQFVRSLISFRSRFDQGFHRMNPVDPINPAAILSPQEQRGEQLFFNFGSLGLLPFRCSSCHETGVQLMDSPSNNGLDVLSIDSGNAGQFRAASLRNIAFSAPYMHDGRFATLREVIEHYDHGIQEAPTLSHRLRESGNGTVRRLNLSASDKDALEAFLHTFTDSAFLDDPKFSDPFP